MIFLLLIRERLVQISGKAFVKISLGLSSLGVLEIEKQKLLGRQLDAQLWPFERCFDWQLQQRREGQCLVSPDCAWDVYKLGRHLPPLVVESTISLKAPTVLDLVDTMVLDVPDGCF